MPPVSPTHSLQDIFEGTRIAERGKCIMSRPGSGTRILGTLLVTLLLSFLLQLATIYVPLFNRIFKTEPLSLDELVFTLAISSVVFFAVEIEKWFKRRQAHP